mmetsp:Transcript_74442/g.147953  ORF Transcript_74442/g.147953 Transcript_74442/m.147953 type:complete len:314 (-) Transcript_74442:668-1609(-)
MRLIFLLVAHASAESLQCGTPLSMDIDFVRDEYAQWKTTFLQAMGSACCIKRPSQSNDCVSEGVGYGMLLSAYLSDEETFRCLWAFAVSHFDADGLMNWRIGPDGSLWGEHSASDADQDMAMALLIACQNFRAHDICENGQSLVQRLPLYTFDNRSVPKPGDNWGGCDGYSPVVNPSYFSPAYYSAWGNAYNESAAWGASVDAVYTITEGIRDPATGLLPDWSDCNKLGAAAMCGQYADEHCQDFYYDAVRTPWRFATDAAWTCSARALEQAHKMLSFFASLGGPQNVREGCTVNGIERVGLAVTEYASALRS